MTIDEAISHALGVAERYERMEDSHDDKLKEECLQCAADHRQLAMWLLELKKAKRLLRQAVEDITFILSYACSDEEMCCEECPTVNHACNKWYYADEALKLIGGATDET